MKKISIRFLKPGRLTVEIPDGEDIKKFCENHISKLSDQELIDAMADYYQDSVNNSIFEEPLIEAIEDPENRYSLLYSTKAWKEYWFGDCELKEELGQR